MEISYFIAIAIGVILLFIVGYYIVYKQIGGKTTEAGKIGSLCNTQQMHCGCFFTNSRCPADTAMSATSKQCPADSNKCTQSNYEGLVADAQAQAKTKKTKSEQDAYYGTCCIVDMSQVSESRLWTDADASAVPTK